MERYSRFRCNWLNKTEIWARADSFSAENWPGRSLPVEHRKNSIAIDSSYIYWVETATTGSNSIKRIPLSGGEEEIIAVNQSNPNEISVDDKYVYWTNYHNTLGDSLRRISK